MDVLISVFDALVQWLGHGFSGFSGWEIVAYTLITTHITIAAVTIFLHRAQAHRALDLHGIPSHFFRFWLWLGSGMVTKEWVAIHRKHHAEVRDRGGPAQPADARHQDRAPARQRALSQRSQEQETLAKYGHGTPDDWLERNLYSRFSWQGVGLMLIADLFLFGAIGATVWAVQMLWIPITAAGIVNGIGHFWGYRNFEAPDASRNVLPWGIVIGGEELHNNHHTYPTSAKLSVKRHEFDIGWMYIRGLEMLGLATVRKTAPQLKLGAIKPVADGKTLEAIIANRYEVMANYARSLRQRQPRRDRPPEGRGRDCRAPRPAAARASLAASRRRQDPARRQGPRRRRPGVEPLPRQAGRDARRAAHALDAHQRVRRAARRRLAGLAAQGRGERDRRPAGLRAASACRPRIARSSPNKRVASATLFVWLKEKGSRRDPASNQRSANYFSFVSL
jgi:stearoyl-CoA desaturase (delta-9 desaturase)